MGMKEKKGIEVEEIIRTVMKVVVDSSANYSTRNLALEILRDILKINKKSIKESIGRKIKEFLKQEEVIKEKSEKDE